MNTMKINKKRFVTYLLVVAIIFTYIALPSYSKAYVKNNVNVLSHEVSRYEADTEILQNMNIPKGIGFKVKYINKDNAIIFISFPKNFPSEKKVYFIKEVQKRIMESKRSVYTIRKYFPGCMEKEFTIP